MENSRRNLKLTSIAILVVTAMSLLTLFAEIFYGEINTLGNSAGLPENVLRITQIFVMSLSILFLLPEFYVGFKGLKEARSPGSSSAHIVWATIIFVISVIALISPLMGLLRREDVKENIRSLLSIGVDVLLYFDYIKFAKAVSDGR